MPQSLPLLCLFEDPGCAQFLPLTYIRPVYNLKCGILSLKEKTLSHVRARSVSLHCREYLADFMRARNPGMVVNELPGDAAALVNGRLVWSDDIASIFRKTHRNDVVYVQGDSVVAAFVTGRNLELMRGRMNKLLTVDDFPGIAREEVAAHLVKYPWDIVHANGAELTRDFESITGTKRSKKANAMAKKRGAILLNEREIYIGEGTSVKPGVILDAEDGPIYIGKDVRLFPSSTIMGPVSIGDRSWVKVNAHIYPNTTVGPVCKVGGEIEGTIIHGYSNKQHHGFIGHSYIGAWANLGAGTSNSDLKNNYGLVRVQTADGMIETGQQFVGLTFGDHSKTAINSMFNTGTVVGVCSNIFGFGFPPKFVPSFSWGAAGETFTTFGIDKAIEMARRVMSRRSIPMSSSEVSIFRTIFDLTAGERRKRGMPG